MNRKERRSMLARDKGNSKNTLGAFKEQDLDIMRNYNLEKNASNKVKHSKTV